VISDKFLNSSSMGLFKIGHRFECWGGGRSTGLGRCAIYMWEL